MVALVSNCKLQNLTLLFTGIVLAGVFWRSGRTKVDEGSWFSISDNTYFPSRRNTKACRCRAISLRSWRRSRNICSPSCWCSVCSPAFRVALLGMTMPSIFVYPEAWWAGTFPVGGNGVGADCTRWR